MGLLYKNILDFQSCNNGLKKLIVVSLLDRGRGMFNCHDRMVFRRGRVFFRRT